MFAASHEDDLYEGEGTPFGKGGGLFSGSGALFGEEEEGEGGEKPSRKNDLEASISSKSTAAGGGGRDLFGDEGENSNGRYHQINSICTSVVHVDVFCALISVPYM